MNPLFFRNGMYSGQVEGYALFWLRVNFAHVGLIIPPRLWKQEAYFKLPAWYRFMLKLLPLLRLDLWAHTGSMDQRWIFRLYLLGFSVGWLTKGDTVNPGFTDRPSGLVFRQGLYGF